MEEILWNWAQVAFAGRSNLQRESLHFLRITERQERQAKEGLSPANFKWQLRDCLNAAEFHGTFITGHIDSC